MPLQEIDASLAPQPAAARPDDGAAQHKLEAMARLGSGLAHDFNNILHVLKSVTELLRRRLPEDDPDIARLLGMMASNVDRATALTRDLLAFSGHQSLHPVALNPNQLVANMAGRLRQSMGRGVAVETVLGGGLWDICADAAELESAIANLALNARDSMPAGGKIVLETTNVTLDAAIRAGWASATGECVAISVRDSGSGMDDETIASAFDPYFTTKHVGSKAGLGLSHVHGFVRQSGGRIEVRSAPGAGTTITLYLPRLPAAAVVGERAAQDAGAQHSVVSGEAAKARSPRRLAGLRVLVVEDESLIGMLAEDLLEQIGCRMVGMVSSLKRGLEMARHADIDFALLDVDLDGEPVYPVAEALQARGLPFAFMSGYGELQAQWRRIPIVQKPFDVAQFQREIERALADS